MDMAEPQGKSLPCGNQAPTILKEESLRKIVAKPRLVHRRAREEIALLLAGELRTDVRTEIMEFLPRFGAFALILNSLEASDLWKDMREIASRGEAATLLVLEISVPIMLDLTEHPEGLERKAEGKEKSALGEFAELMAETRDYWDNRSWGELAIDLNSLSELEKFLASNQSSVLNQLLTRTITKRSERKIKELLRTVELLDTLARLLPSEYAGRLADLYALYIKDIDAFAQVLKRSQDLKQILQMMGRMEAEASSRRAKLIHFTSNESHSLHQSHDIHRVLPIELVKLRNPTLRKLFYARFLEGKLLSYELKKPDKKPNQLGPVVALVDASGSMCGDPEAVAKALILAIAKRMAKEKRAVKVILFSTKNRMQKIDLSLESSTLNDFLDFLSYVFEGGTDFDSALKAGREELEKEGWRKSDLLFISDGLSTVSDEAVREWDSYRSRTGSRIFTLVVGSDNSGGLERISDFASVVNSPKRWYQEKGPADILQRID